MPVARKRFRNVRECKPAGGNIFNNTANDILAIGQISEEALNLSSMIFSFDLAELTPLTYTL
jgi:hypothetical protein